MKILQVLAPAAIIGFSLWAPSAAHANLISDGSFEDPVIADSWYEEYGTAGDPHYGGPSFNAAWAITNNVDIVSSLTAPGNAAAAEGTQYLDLVGNGAAGGISQIFATTPGKSYALSFAYGNNPWSTTTASAQFTVVLSDDLSPIIVTHDTSTTADIDWTQYYLVFVATDPMTTLSFLNTVGANAGGVLLDDISVTPTPLPATWSMLLAGFVGLAFAAYRKRAGVAAAV